MGEGLLQEALKVGRARRLQHATLHVNLANDAARSLYASVGFRDAGLLHDYYRSALFCAEAHVTMPDLAK